MFFVYFPKGNYRFTFAWFQATSAVQISASSSSTTITVSEPEGMTVEPTIYAYKDNFTDLGGSKYLNHGYSTSSESNKVSMLFEKHDSANYFYSYGGDSVAGYSSTKKLTKIYTGHMVSFVPEVGHTIDTIVITTDSSGSYANALAGMSWVNGSATKDSTTQVTVEAEDGDEIISLVATATIWITGVTVNYTDSSDTAWDLTKAEYAYCGDNIANYEKSTNSAEKMVWFSSSTPAIISRDFMELSSLAKRNALLNTRLLSPGYKYTFAIKAVCSKEASAAEFFLEKYTSIRFLNRKIWGSIGSANGYIIAMDEAIKITGSINCSGWYFGSTAQRFSFNYATTPTSTTMDVTGGNVQTNVYDSEGASNPFTHQSIGSSSDLGQEEVYFFFTVELNNANTTYYQEYDSSNNALNKPEPDYVLPVSWDSSRKYYRYSSDDAAYKYFSSRQPTKNTYNNGEFFLPNDRYFLKATSGNSNCYAGLTFQIDTIQLVIG